jgi:hypothetical protein
MNIPSKLYHATLRSNLGKIIGSGLKAGIDGVIYFSDSCINASKFLAIRGTAAEDIIVFEIPMNLLKKDKIRLSNDHSVKFFECEAWDYPETIPAKVLLKGSIFEMSSVTITKK